MAKTKKEKEGIVTKLSEQLDQAKSAVIVNYKGLTVKECEELRKELQKNEVAFSVTKNSLFKIALREKSITVDDKIMDQPLALAFGSADEISAAKGINQFAKEHEALEILGGIYEKKYIEKERVIALASISSKEELYSQLVNSLASPIKGMLNVLVGNICGLVNVLNQYKASREA